MKKDKFTNFQELARYASSHRRLEEAATVNNGDAPSFWAEITRWANECHEADMDPQAVMLTETRKLSKEVVRAQIGNRETSTDQIGLLVHHVMLLRLMVADAGKVLPKAVEGYVEAILIQADRLKPAA